MTKIYLGSDVHKYTFDDGKSIELNSVQVDEIAAESSIAEDLHEELEWKERAHQAKLQHVHTLLDAVIIELED